MPHLEEGQLAVGRWDDEDDPVATATVRASVEVSGVNGAPSAAAAAEELDDTPVTSVRATLRRMGVRPATDDEAALRATLVVALHTAKIKLVRGLLMERGGTCVGCTERPEFVAAVLDSLRQPLVARHALPLFLYDQPLFPHTQLRLHLFEPRYKLACRKALKADQIFGFVSPTRGVGVGTLARIRSSRFKDDDARDGQSPTPHPGRDPGPYPDPH